ncbi:uncharacterized protein LOC135494571 [Lineus longissimus]|uniref:uncharacterized protein LOC135494571 n=1 Tax=Lineus longissimus TaxID=88925 RepID=UPI00315CD5B9
MDPSGRVDEFLSQIGTALQGMQEEMTNVMVGPPPPATPGSSGRMRYSTPYGATAESDDELFHKKPVVLPDWYNNDGKTDFEDWVERVRIVQRVNHWSEEQLMSFVPLRLKDDAFRVYKDMHDFEKCNFDTFCETFRLRGCPADVKVFKARLAARRKLETETYVQLAADIRRLVLKAFPSAGVAIREEMAVDYFTQALTDREVRLQVRRADCDTLDDALSRALAEESFQRAEKPGEARKGPQKVNMTRPGVADGPSGPGMQKQIDALSKKLNDALVALGQISTAPGRRARHWFLSGRLPPYHHRRKLC